MLIDIDKYIGASINILGKIQIYWDKYNYTEISMSTSAINVKKE